MIECCKENIYYIKKRRKCRKKFKRLFVLFLILGIVLFLYFYTRNVVFDNLLNVCSDMAYKYSAQAVNECVLEEFKDEFKYGELVKVEKNSAGDITLISTDSVKINQINRNIAMITEKKLEEKLAQGIPVPLFAFTGIKFISGYGDNVDFKAYTVSSVECKFRDKFESVGVNQTLHSLYIDVESKYSVEFPLNRRSAECVTSVLISESIIIGKIPDVYLSK